MFPADMNNEGLINCFHIAKKSQNVKKRAGKILSDEDFESWKLIKEDIGIVTTFEIPRNILLSVKSSASSVVIRNSSTKFAGNFKYVLPYIFYQKKIEWDLNITKKSFSLQGKQIIIETCVAYCLFLFLG